MQLSENRGVPGSSPGLAIHQEISPRAPIEAWPPATCTPGSSALMIPTPAAGAPKMLPVQDAIGIPLLHIADATARRVRAAGVDTVGLRATRYTMEQDFYRGRLATGHGLQLLVPPEPDLTLVHDVIYAELCQGRVLDRSREEYRRIIAGLEPAGSSTAVRRSISWSARTMPPCRSSTPRAFTSTQRSNGRWRLRASRHLRTPQPLRRARAIDRPDEMMALIGRAVGSTGSSLPCSAGWSLERLAADEAVAVLEAASGRPVADRAHRAPDGASPTDPPSASTRTSTGP
jgi:hypothetical protein